MGTGEGNNQPSTGRWPIGVAGSLAAVALIAAAFTWASAGKVEGDADDGEAAAVMAEREATEMSSCSARSASGRGAVDSSVDQFRRCHRGWPQMSTATRYADAAGPRQSRY